MFITHYDKSFIDCSNIRFDYLLYNSKVLFNTYSMDIYEHELIDALYFNDDIYYSAKFLFESKKEFKSLHKNYCNLAKLVYMHYCKVYSYEELNSIVSSMCIKPITIEDIYSYY